MVKKGLAVAVMVATAGLFAGCSTAHHNGTVYSASEANQVHTVRYGVIDDAQRVVVEGNTNGEIGTVSGGIIGGIAGSSLGGGRGSAIYSVLGVLAGGTLGKELEKHFTRTDAQQMTIRLENGRIISIVQALSENEQPFAMGTRVKVVEQGNKVVVLPY